jgi:GNAT superfamily N-acetyltransferase
VRDTELRLERLPATDDLGKFDSGIEILDTWLKRHAITAQAIDPALTFVVVQTDRIVGYASLTVGPVQRADAPAKLVRGLPAYPVGMVLIARLAIDRSEQGRGLGSRLFSDALRHGFTARLGESRLSLRKKVTTATRNSP